MSFAHKMLAFTATLGDSVAGPACKSDFDEKFLAACMGASKSDLAEMALRLASAAHKMNPKQAMQWKNGQLVQGKSKLNELSGLELCNSPEELLSALQANATNPKYFRVVQTNKNKGLRSLFFELEMIPASQDTISGLSADELDVALKSCTEKERAAMLKSILGANGDSISGYDSDTDSVADVIEGLRRQARVQNRIEARGERQDSRGDNREGREERKARAIVAKNAGVEFDEDDTFIAQDGKIYHRSQQRRLMPVVNASSTAGGQNSLANTVSGTYTGAPSLELEIIKLRIRIEGGSTNVEIQSTLVASFAVTSLKIGSVELIVGTGGVEFPDGDGVDPSFWRCLVVTGGNSNLTVTIRNEGATQVFIVSAYCRVVQAA